MKSWDDFGITVPPSAHGPEVYTTCPKCSPSRKNFKSKCLSVNIVENVFCCHHCGWAGSLSAGEWKRPEVKRVYTKPKYTHADGDEKLFDWFKGRGISKEVVTRNKLTAGKVWMPQIDKETTAIRFPFFRKGEVVNIKSRDKDKNFRMESNAERIFYGMDDVAPGEIAIIVEGEIDKLSLEMAGFKNCVSVPDGAPSEKAKDYASKFEFLDDCAEWVEQVGQFIIAVDTDGPGRKLEEELSRRLGMDRCLRVQWPDGCKDANEVLLKLGANALKVFIVGAKPFPIDGVYTTCDFHNEIESLYDKGHQRGSLCGWEEFDKLYSMVPGELTVVTGIPSHGKSEFVDAMLTKLILRHGYRFAIFSPENQPLAYHFFKFAEKFIGKPSFEQDRISRDELLKARQWFDEHLRLILPKPDNRSLENVLAVAEKIVKRDGIRGVVFDPWNEFEHRRRMGWSEHEYVGWALMKIKEFAKINGVHVWIVAHPTKMQRDLNLQKKGIEAYLVPRGYDISGSANWVNKPEIVISVYRWFDGPQAGEVDVHVQKCRFKGTGKPGAVTFQYDKASGRYNERNEEDTKHWQEEQDLPGFD